MRLFNLQKKTTLLNTLRKYASVFHRNIESLQWHSLKNIDGGVSTESTVKLQ